MQKQVIIVDRNNRTLGYADKLLAHQEGLLHRAFSIFVYRRNEQGEIEHLLQQRAASKYHSGGVWSNACCGHPEPQFDGEGEIVARAARQRLQEEMGLVAQGIMQEIDCHYYKVVVGEGMQEHEIDHILKVEYAGEEITPNPQEVQAWRWVKSGDLLREMETKPQIFSAWLGFILPRIIDKI